MATIPRTLGDRYEVGELLGRGGMAEVHRGRDTRLGRQVAVKVLRSELARDPSFQARFRREAQSAASLNHPAVVAVYDTGEDVSDTDGGQVHTPYIIMEYVRGHTLREVLRDRAPEGVDDDHPGTGTGYGLEPAEAARVTAGVLQALAYSHSSGIIHRDIKPANVMLTPTGDVKVMDFGIARAIADSSATMTQTQAVIGTAQYLSPEQARGEQVDARSDLYSAGCLLYELLTGRPPFVGDSAVAVAYQHVREQPRPPSELVPGIPEALDRVVLKALAKDRDDRYPDAGSFRRDLLAAVEGRAVSAPPVAAATAATSAVGGVFAARSGEGTVTFGRVEDDEPQRRRWGSYLLLALAVLAVLALSAALARQLFTPEPTGAVQVQVPSVMGADRDTARTEIEGVGLVYDEEVTEDDAAEGTVVDQNPPARTPVDEGSRVLVTVSGGPGEVAVPDVRGQSQEQAGETLRDAGLALGQVTPEDDAQARPGAVLRTAPEAGEQVTRGSAVDLVVASGQVSVPDVTGQNYRDARQTLVDLGLPVEIEFEDSDQPQDQVLRQQPGPGRVPQGTAIVLVASDQQRPEPTQTAEPTATPTSGPTGEPTDGPTGDAAPPADRGDPGGDRDGDGDGDEDGD